MGLISTIESIADLIKNNSYRSEADIREAVVNRILSDLGWDVYDPNVVKREYTVEKRRVDYALFTSSASAAVFIEAKALSAGDEGDRQLFEYAFYRGTPFAILVNGREWSFYLPAEQGNIPERRVQKLDIVERNPSDSALILERYLRFDRVRDGSAYSDARSDYQSAARQRDAGRYILKAWTELISKPDELLIELIAEKVVSLIGFRPVDEQIEEFLLNSGPAGPKSITQTESVTNAGPPRESTKLAGRRKITFRYLGQEFSEPDAISALTFLIQKLAERNVNFLPTFAERAPGRSRNHIATVRSQVYPGNPELEVYTTEIAPGWWLGTNIANRDKQRLVQIACDVAGLSFGKDIVIEFPNVSN